MLNRHSIAKQLLKLSLACCVVATAAGCSPESDGESIGNGARYEGAVTPTENFVIPQAEPDGNGGYRIAAATDGNFPAVPVAKILRSAEKYGLEEAAQPAKIELGDLVSIRWKMYSLRSGGLVEDSDELLDGEAAKIILGGGKGAEIDVPQEMHDALLGQRIGDRVQVVFQYGMPSLPDYLDSDDAYTLIVDIVSKG